MSHDELLNTQMHDRFYAEIRRKFNEEGFAGFLHQRWWHNCTNEQRGHPNRGTAFHEGVNHVHQPLLPAGRPLRRQEAVSELPKGVLSSRTSSRLLWNCARVPTIVEESDQAKKEHQETSTLPSNLATNVSVHRHTRTIYLHVTENGISTCINRSLLEENQESANEMHLCGLSC